MNADHYNPALPYHEPTDVATEIIKLAGQSIGSCVNMTLEETK